MLELEFQYRFESAHRFLKSTSKCTTPHGHSYQIRLSLEAKENRLDERGMLEDFSVLKKDWRLFVDETLDHSFFHHFQDPLASFLVELMDDPRLLAFPADPTTELFTALCFQKALRLFQTPKLTVKEVYIEETATNKVRCSPKAYEELRAQYKLDEAKSWWNTSDALDRSFTTPA